MVDIETDEEIEVSPEYAHTEYRDKVDAHIEAMKKAAQGTGLDYMMVRTASRSTRLCENISPDARGECKWAFWHLGFSPAWPP